MTIMFGIIGFAAIVAATLVVIRLFILHERMLVEGNKLVTYLFEFTISADSNYRNTLTLTAKHRFELGGHGIHRTVVDVIIIAVHVKGNVEGLHRFIQDAALDWWKTQQPPFIVRIRKEV